MDLLFFYVAQVQFPSILRRYYIPYERFVSAESFPSLTLDDISGIICSRGIFISPQLAAL